MLQTLDTRKILILDSGVGGLSIAKAIRASTPGVLIDYLADYEYFPYGDKTEHGIQERVSALLTKLIPESKPDLIVIACNTASTTVLDKLRSQFHMPFVGVVPAIKPAISISSTGVIGVLATPGTIARAYTQNLITEFAGGKRVLLQGSTRLVEQAELKLYGLDTCSTTIKAELESLLSQPGGETIDTVVLGCTHFPLLKAEMIDVSERKLTWVDSSDAIARRAQHCLLTLEQSSGSKLKREDKQRFYVTRNKPQIKSIEFKKWMGEAETKVVAL